MYIATVPNRKLPPAILLRESYREAGKVKSRTLANLSKLPAETIEVIRQSLKGTPLAAADDTFEVVASPTHGHVHAVLLAMRRLGFAELIASQPTPERDRVRALVAARIVEPHSKLATTRWWHDTTLPKTLGVADADENDLYAAMDWLLERQNRIERKLAARHWDEDSVVLYDLSSSYFEGPTCPLAARGHNHDGKKGKLQVNYGVLTNAEGVPLSVSVFRGNTADPKTLLPQVDKVRERFGIERFVRVGDRGMITQRQVDALQAIEGIDWIAALRPNAIHRLVDDGAVQMDLFDERNLFELTHPDFPGERLVACRNPQLAQRRADKRQSLLEATTRELEKVQGMAGRGRLRGQDAIGVRVGQGINKYKMAKHVHLDIRDEGFDFEIDADSVAREAALDGLYVIRTSVTAARLSTAGAVRSYKQLNHVERAFRSFKTIDLNVRPIRHRCDPRVRAHIFLCLLAYYVQWHMLEAWRPLLFSDENLQAKATRDPVAPAQRSAGAQRKVAAHTLDDGSEVHSFRTLMHHLGSIVRNVCRVPGAEPGTPTFEIETTPNRKQQQAFDLLNTIRM
jgi:transposase